MTNREPTPREAPLAKMAAVIPDDRDELLQLAQRAVAAIDASVIEGNEDEEISARVTYEAIIYKLNGGTMFASADGPESPAHVVAAHCAAPIGTAPGWRQHGEFVATIDGMRARVKVGDGFTGTYTHLSFYAIDRDRPFISETGYKSHFQPAVQGHTLAEVATAVLASFASKKRGRVAIERGSRGRVEVPAWIDAQPDAEAPATFVEASGQAAFAF